MRVWMRIDGEPRRAVGEAFVGDRVWTWYDQSRTGNLVWKEGCPDGKGQRSAARVKQRYRRSAVQLACHLPATREREGGQNVAACAVARNHRSLQVGG